MEDAAPETIPEPAAVVETVPPSPAPSPEPPKFRLIAREAVRLQVPLTVEERAEVGEKIANLSREMRRLEVEHEEANVAARAEAKLRREGIQDAQAALDNALVAQTTGVETRVYPGERRAMVAACTIDLVRLDTGEVVESRAMTEGEQARWCRQGSIEEAAGGATIRPGAQDAPEASLDFTESEGGDEEPAAGDSDTLTDDEADALGLPKGWPRAWRDQTWKVGDTELSEGDIREVYIRLEDAGTTIAELLEGREGVAAMDWLDAKRVGRALALLRQKKLVGKMVIAGAPTAWAPTAALAELLEEPEPGRADPLPEAADAPRPKRQGKKRTKADAIVNEAAEQSDGWAL